MQGKTIKTLPLHRGNLGKVYYSFNTRSLHVFITKLRHKLSRDSQVKIINVRGIGYKLI